MQIAGGGGGAFAFGKRALVQGPACCKDDPLAIIFVEALLPAALCLALMGRVCIVTGEDLMAEAEFAAWWEEHRVQSGMFVDELWPGDCVCEVSGSLR